MAKNRLEEVFQSELLRMNAKYAPEEKEIVSDDELLQAMIQFLSVVLRRMNKIDTAQPSKRPTLVPSPS